MINYTNTIFVSQLKKRAIFFIFLNFILKNKCRFFKPTTYVAFLIINLHAFNCKAQKPSIDSLTKVFLVSNDTSKVLLLANISKYIAQNDPKQAEILGDSAIGMAKRIGFEKGLARSYEALANAQNTTGKYDLAIRNLEQALVIYKKTKNKTGTIQILNTLGNAYLGAKRYNTALDNYTEAYKLATNNVKLNHLKAIVGSGIATVLLEQKNYLQALNYLNEAYEIFTGNKNEMLIAYTKANIADCQLRMGNYANAEKNFKAVIVYFKQIDDDYALALNYNNLGKLYSKKKAYNNAIPAFKTALNISLKRKAWDNIQENALALSVVYELSGNTSDALTNYKLYAQYKDSVSNKFRDKSVAEFQTKFETEKIKNEVVNANEKVKLSNLLLNQKKNEVSRNYIFLIVLFGFLIAVLILFLRAQVAKKTIQAQKNSLAVSLFEKETLLKELHHRVKNNLQVIIGLLQLQVSKVKQPEVTEVFIDASHKINSMALVHDMLFAQNDFTNIAAQTYITKLVSQVLLGLGAQHITYSLNCDDVLLPANKAIPLGLIITELITNSYKHAFTNNTGQITIALKATTENKYTIVYTDNGQGLPTNYDVNTTKTMGLKLIHLLADEMNASIDIKSKHGLQVTLIVK